MRSTQGRGLLLLRDSGGQHETTPVQYVEWAQRESGRLGVRFEGTAAAVETMIRERECQRGDIFMDYGISGNILSRPGLNAMIDQVRADPTVSHIFIPRRDRLARADNPVDALVLEGSLQRMGLTIVYTTQTLAPVLNGQRSNIADQIVALIEFEHASQERVKLAGNMILAQLTLARLGFTTGGRAPYGFRRWLVREDGTPIRELADGEKVRMRGHHVVWLPLPADHPEMITIQRIIDLLFRMPAARIARILTAEGVPTPDHGRIRKDNGIYHATSGVWHSTTITNIGRNSLLIAIVRHGRRGIGDRLRFTPNGPRPLKDSDYQDVGGKQPKIVANSSENILRTKARFDPVVDKEKFANLEKILDQRAGTQRGKPRSRNPDANPLGGRIYDVKCRWLMYRQPHNNSYRYTCGSYLQSHGAECAHNHVDGPTISRYLLEAIQRQGMLAPHFLDKLYAKLQLIAQAEQEVPSPSRTVADALEKIEQQLDTISSNMALAKSPAQFEAMSKIFDQLTEEKTAAQSRCNESSPYNNPRAVTEAIIARAMEAFETLPHLAADPSNYAHLGELFRSMNVHVFLEFAPHRRGKRILNKLVKGSVTFGDAVAPIEPYAGPTARKKNLKTKKTATFAADLGAHENALRDHVGSGQEGTSLRNVNRGDKI